MPAVLVVFYAGFLVAAVVHRTWTVAGIFAVFLVLALVMLRQRLRTGDPIPLLATVVRLLLKR